MKKSLGKVESKSKKYKTGIHDDCLELNLGTKKDILGAFILF